jgi:formiminotetrahydrofolate cyclodeaminase
MSFPEQSLESFLDDLASSSPAPGGGSVAALAGALGAALVSMVGSLTLGKEKFKDVEPEVQAIRARSEALRQRLLACIDEDVAAFNGYSAAARLPKDTAEQKAARSAAIQKALMNAVDPPMNTAKACVDVLDLCLPIAEKGNPQAVSDAGVGALMAEAGLRAAALNVRINLGWIKDAEFVARKSAELDALLKGRAEQKEKIVQYVESKL